MVVGAVFAHHEILNGLSYLCDTNHTIHTFLFLVADEIIRGRRYERK